MKCEECGEDYPSKYHFMTETICKECYGKLNPDKKEVAPSSNAIIDETHVTKRKRSAGGIGCGILLIIMALGAMANFLKTMIGYPAEVAGALFAFLLMIGFGIKLIIGKKVKAENDQ